MGQLILTKAKELFFSYGLKSVSMDDLAKLAGISQRGQAEGLYRREMHLGFIADLRIHQLSSALQPNGFISHKVSAGQYQKELTIFYLHGITTEKKTTH